MFHAFEHQLIKLFREFNLKDTGLVLAVSGGLDSAVMLSAIQAISKPLGLRIQAAFVHHGPTPVLTQSEYRKKAEDFVRSACASLEVEFVALGPAPFELKSEAEMREFRYSLLLKQINPDFPWLALGHHADDLLETRLQRLIRGTGHLGLAAMHVCEAPLFRPLLKFTREDLESYAKQKKLQWLEDPSNLDQSYLRNWLRGKWLADLEARAPGSKRAMARSLDLLVADVEEALPIGLFLEQGLCRVEFSKLSVKSQWRALAEYLSRIGVRDFSHSQILEVVKQLDISQREHTFISARCLWSTNAQQIVALRQP